MSCGITLEARSPLDVVRDRFSGKLPEPVLDGERKLAERSVQLLKYDGLKEQLAEDETTLAAFERQQRMAQAMESLGAKFLNSDEVAEYKAANLKRVCPRFLRAPYSWVDGFDDSNGLAAFVVIITFVWSIITAIASVVVIVDACLGDRGVYFWLQWIGSDVLCLYTWLKIFQLESLGWDTFRLSEYDGSVPEMEVLGPSVALAERFSGLKFFVEIEKNSPQRLAFVEYENQTYYLSAWKEPEHKKRLH